MDTSTTWVHLLAFDNLSDLWESTLRARKPSDLSYFATSVLQLLQMQTGPKLSAHTQTQIVVT